MVLPQGDFAEFLRAKGSDRREILLKLLGAGLYKEIGQAANSRASLAGQRATLLADQLTGYLDATAHTEELAADLKAAQLVAAVDAQLSTATDRVTALQTALAGQPTDEAVIRESLSGLDRLDTQARVADEAVQQARTQYTAAQSAVRQAEADAAVLRRSLHRARDPLVALGAPGVDGSHLLSSWTQLTDWAAAQSGRQAAGTCCRPRRGRRRPGRASPRRQSTDRRANESRTGPQGGDGGHRFS